MAGEGMRDDDYVFPFNTCERPATGGVAQPYSAAVNAVNCAMIFAFLIQTTEPSRFLFILSILMFEAFHTFSHIIHIPGPIQTRVIHALAYGVNAALLYLFTKAAPAIATRPVLAVLAVLVCLDLYAFTHLTVDFYIATQAAIFVAILLFYYHHVPPANIALIIALAAVVIGLVMNERYNCHRMQASYPGVPFHVLIEGTGLALFYVVCKTFYR